MAGFLLLILCLNIDALSFGVAYGIKKVKFSLWFVLKVSILSSIFFAIPLLLSQFLFKYFDKTNYTYSSWFFLFFKKRQRIK